MKWLIGMPKFCSTVLIRTSLPLVYALLIRLLSFVPAIGTHRSRGMERIAAFPDLGSKRRIMIVSERRPGAAPSLPMAP